MIQSPSRRRFLLAAATFPIAGSAALAADGHRLRIAERGLADLERSFKGRVGVYALNTATGATVTHRADERFPVCSTFKVLLISAILRRSGHDTGLLDRHIRFTQGDIVTYSPITEKQIDTGMTVSQLCAAAIQYSDNTAANQLMKIVGGPAAVTAFARSIGDHEFRLDRWETDLNTALPGDLRDTSTPRAMGRDLQRLVVGDTLTVRQRAQLREWMLGNTTGAARIRTGVPTDWKVADKTGTGDYGSANDIGIVWPPHRTPVVIAIYTTQRDKEAKARNDVIAAAARIVTGAIR